MRRIEILEAVRGLAALYVAIGHLVLQVLQPSQGIVRFLFQFGQEAVIVFFLLSGFVIELSAGKRWDGWASYLLRRAVRIYPAYLIALLCTFIAVGIFDHNWSINGVRLLGNISMLQDFASGKPGVIVTTYKGNTALWSLAYEWWFYLLYIPFRQRPRARLEIGILSFGAAALYLASPFGIWLYLAYFVLWWAGVALAREWRDNGTLTLRGQSLSLLSIGAVACLFFGEALCSPRPWTMGTHPFLELRHLVFGLALIFLAVGSWRWKWHRTFGKSLAPLASLGAISYSLYVLHMPLLILGHTSAVSVLLFRAALLIVLCLFLEKKVQPCLNQIFGTRRAAKLEEMTPA
ncbi:acyltransferase [soil metagenome]